MDKCKRINPVKGAIEVIHTHDNFLVKLEENSYELDKNQYKAIMRKKNMPTERLKVWLKTYAEENEKNSDEWQ